MKTDQNPVDDDGGANLATPRSLAKSQGRLFAGFNTTREFIAALDAACASAGMPRANFMRAAVAAAVADCGVPVPEGEIMKKQGQRTDFSDAARRAAALDQLSRARASRNYSAPKSEAARKKMLRRDAVAKERLMAKGISELCANAIVETRANAEMKLGRALTRREWSRLQNEVLMLFLRKKNGGDDAAA